MFRRMTGMIIVLVAAIIVLAGCGHSGVPTQATTAMSKVTDIVGREVNVPVAANRIVAVGPGVLRLVCYDQAADKVVGVESVEKQWPEAIRPYILAYPQLKDRPVIGQGGPEYVPNTEKLVEVKPDVIFVSSVLVNGSQADELQSKTGIPVVVLSYSHGRVGYFDDDLYRSLQLIGQIIGNEQRANNVVAFLKNCQQDLDMRTKNIPADQKPTVYAGALSMKGTYGIESTQAQYPPFVAINAKNLADETGTTGSVMIDKEKLLIWNPEIIIIDELGLSLVRDDYKNNPQFYQSLRAFKNGRIYVQIPYNFYATNIGAALVDAYYAGKVIYPVQFSDVDPPQKANEIYQFLLGKPLYQQIANGDGGFRKLNLEESSPN
ncbi:iron ABC transporter substrate-binding protein [Sporomusa acidovorans]|uniref:Fe/B12 periplasmic-binding domain-containing protein n=1 Tax=Sporomusa acidovorans (strain ATCC 49682 / DSM 3132 / Mol) TaxID=1123286 RepID=A0ABZ3IY21_SPOA4|nr:iron ABC transporter substrate-binding protein [Sporomusa acidovorans]OZC22173.1 periplasmic binding protein [Sporomusa acidovorans DSM 3132]SDE82182.1 iron complex transport system substrate-binding protein [Sporomusa acidovorans]